MEERKAFNGFGNSRVMRRLLVTVKMDNEDKRLLEDTVGDHAAVHYLREEPEAEAILPEVEVVLCAGLRMFTPEALQSMRSLRMIQTLMAGADHLPGELFRRGVAICTGSGIGSHRIAEHAFALLLAAAKNVVTHTNNIRQGRFDRSPVNVELKDSTLAVLGYGHIGRIVGRLGRGFGMRVMAISRSGRADEWVEFAGTPKDLPHVLTQADFIVVCLPLTKHTEGLIGRDELKMMKPNAILVNVGRARVVDESALYEHLKSNPSFRAAFDVWWQYPSCTTGYPFSQPFHELDNFVMTPHVADHVAKHRKDMMRFAIENIGNYFIARPLLNRVGVDDEPP